MQRQRYPAGEQSFKNIREDSKVYVDKTKIIYDLVNNPKYVFLQRPRRFGKSLLLSTIKAYFEGEKKLFEGLAISELEKDWKKHPVFHLELSGIDSNNPESLPERLDIQFREWEKVYGNEESLSSYGARFGNLIRKAAEKTGERAVILVDEYDNPLINTLNKKERLDDYRELLRSIYSNLKSMDEYIRFGMLTGVSRFSKTSIFSGLNNLTDITFDNRYATICGFTEDEIHRFLRQGVTLLGEELETNTEDALTELKRMYDGYHFSRKCPDIYNPYSLIRCLDASEIKNYWFETATPKFLVEKLKETDVSFLNLFNGKVPEESLTESDTAFSSPVSLLYQTGYLTIKGYDKNTLRYFLGVPNREVETSLFSYLLSQFIGRDKVVAEDYAAEIVGFLRDGNPREFMQRLESFLGSIPYDLMPAVSEKYFQHVLYLIFRVTGTRISAEEKTSFSRSDIIVMTDRYIYIFELKLNESADVALKQIEDKKYALPYQYDGRKIFKIGVNFSSETRNIAEWKYATHLSI